MFLYKTSMHIGIYIPPDKEVIMKNNRNINIAFDIIGLLNIESIPK